MKTVLIVLPNDALGGAEQYLKMIAKYFVRNNYQVHVLFLKKEQYLGWKDIRSNNLMLYFTNSDSELKGVFPLLANIRKIRKTQFNYIFTSHVHLTSFISILIKTGYIKKGEFIGRESTSVFKRYHGFNLFLHQMMYRVGYSSSIDLLICQTEYMKAQLIEALPWLQNKTRIEVLTNPIDLQSMYSEEMTVDGNEFLPSSDYIVAAGRLIDEKGFDLLIQAYGEILKEKPLLKLLILGEGKERQKLELLVKDLKLENCVFLPGHVKNVLPYFKYSAVCVVSSRIEGFPNVLLQMMSQNTQIVATKCAGGIEDIKGVFLAETNSTKSLLVNLRQALNEERAHNREYFDYFLDDIQLDSFISKIQKLLRGPL